MKRLIEIKKDLRGEGISYRSFVRPMEDTSKNIIINITQIEPTSQERKAKKQLFELTEILFDAAAETEDKYYREIIFDPERAVLLRNELNVLIDVIKRAGLYEWYKIYRSGGYDNAVQ